MSEQSPPRSRARMAQQTEIAGKYQLIAELGQGGMATVYLAVLKGPSTFRKLAVVKQLRPDMAQDPDFVEMFMEEARLAARLNHPNVVNTYEVGDDDGLHYLAMEYLDGASLQAIIARCGFDGSFTFAHYLRVMIDVLGGLQHAHELADFDGSALHLVHRDVSPHNILTTFDGQSKLVDFGIAKAANSAVETRTGVIKGKITYMAPEQAINDNLDCRADLYAIGVMLWEAAAGRRRWKGMSNIVVLQKLTSKEAPVSPEAEKRGLPARVNEIVLKAIANDPADRYQNAVDFQRDLEDLSRELPERIIARDVGKVLQEAFKNDRDKRRTVIDSQIKALEEAEREGLDFEISNELEESAPGTGSNTLNSRKSMVRGSALRQSVVTMTNPLASTSSLAATGEMAIAPPAPNRTPLIAALAGISILAGGAAVYSATRKPVAAAATAAETAPTSAATASATAAATVNLSVAVRPSNAKIFLDGLAIDGNPAKITKTKDGASHRVTAQADGYDDGGREVTFAADATIEFELTKTKPGAPKGAYAGATAAKTGDGVKPTDTKPVETTKVDPTPAPTASGKKKGLDLDRNIDPFGGK
jgi:serine/threonine protein kinase